MEKPEVKIENNRDTFNILSKCSFALNTSKMYKEANEMQIRVLSCETYDEAVLICSEYCELITD